MTPTPPPPRPHDDPVAGLSDVELRTLLDGVTQRTLDHPPTLHDRLREAPTSARVALAVALGFVVGGLDVLAVGVRPDLDAAGWRAVALGLVPVIALLVVGVATALRGVHRRSLGVGGVAVAGVALAAPVVFGLVPGWPGIDVSSLPDAPRIHVACFVDGLVVASVFLLFARVLSRRDAPSALELGLFAGAGGLVAYATLASHCAANDPVHLVAGHGVAGLLLASAAVAVAAGRAARRSAR